MNVNIQVINKDTATRSVTVKIVSGSFTRTLDGIEAQNKAELINYIQSLEFVRSYFDKNRVKEFISDVNVGDVLTIPDYLSPSSTIISGSVNQG